MEVFYLRLNGTLLLLLPQTPLVPEIATVHAFVAANAIFMMFRSWHCITFASVVVEGIVAPTAASVAIRTAAGALGYIESTFQQ